MSLRAQLKGTGVALATPFHSDKSIDFAALQKLINFVIEGGVQYIVSLGTTGETPVLTREEQKEVFLFTLDAVQQRVPVVIGIGGNNTAAVVHNFSFLGADKAAAILSASPYYNKPSQEGIFQHYKALAEAAPKPLILYNVPGRTGSNITAHTCLRLAAEVPNVQGIKEASGNMVQCMHILRHRPQNFLVTSGDDHVTMPLIACGMDGVISVAANCFPKDFCRMVALSLEGNFAAAQPLQYKLLEGYDLLFAENNPAGLKAFLSELGLIRNELRLPVVPLSAGIHAQVKAYLQQLQAT